MIRILQWGMVPGLCGGVETFIMNVYRNIDREQIQFDFLLYEGSDRLFFEDEIISLGGHIYREYIRVKKSPFRHYKQIDTFFENHPEIRGVHYNATALFDIDVIIAAKRNNLPIRIIHSHNTNYDKKNTRWYLNIIDGINRKKIKRYVTNFFACSKEAGRWMFGDSEFTIINNGIDIKEKGFHWEDRIRIRRQLNIEDRIVCILVGRLEVQKNPMFALEVIDAIKDKCPQICCLFVGDGMLRTEMEDYIEVHSLKDYVRILGNRRDVSALLSGADIFLFPSLYEGLGISALEAQASGLSCIISDTVPQTVVCSDNTRIVKLNDLEMWTKSLESCIRCISSRVNDTKYLNETRGKCSYDVQKAGYDIIETVRVLQRIYLSAIK